MIVNTIIFDNIILLFWVYKNLNKDYFMYDIILKDI